MILPTTVTGTKDNDLAAQFMIRRQVMLLFVYYPLVMPTMMVFVAAVSPSATVLLRRTRVNNPCTLVISPLPVALTLLLTLIG